MPVAIPLVMAAVSAGGAVASHYAQQSAQKAASAYTPQEQAALDASNKTAGQLSTTGAALTKTGADTTATGLGTMAPAASYFKTLLTGNRAAMSQATAGPRGALADTYTGAARSLEQGGVRGAAKDVATGELARSKAGAISSLITGVQPAAAGALAGIGGQQAAVGAQQTGAGVSATEGAGNIYGNVLDGTTQKQQFGYQAGAQEGQQVGSAFGQFISGLVQYYGGKGTSLPKNATLPPKGAWMGMPSALPGALNTSSPGFG